MADPITALIIAVKAVVVSFVAAYKASAIIRAIVMIVAVIAVTAISQALIGQSTPKNNQGQELALKLDPTMPRQVATGPTATGGSLLFSKTFTEDPAVPSGKLIRVIALSDRPSKLTKITEGSQDITFHGSTSLYASIAFNEVDQHRSLGGIVRMYVYFVPGSDDPDSDPISANGRSWLRDNCGWVTSDLGVGMCWAIVAYNYDQDAFPQGEPSIVFHLQGTPLFDPRQAFQLFEEAWFPTSLAVIDATKPFMPSADFGWDTQAGQRAWVSGRKLIWLGWHQELPAATTAAQTDPGYSAAFTIVPMASPLAYTLRVGNFDVAPGANLYAFQWLSQRVLEMDMDTHVVSIHDPHDPTYSWLSGQKLALSNDWGWAQQQTIDQRNGDMIIAGDIIGSPVAAPRNGGQVIYFLRRATNYKLHMNFFSPMGNLGSGIEDMGGAQLWLECVGKDWTVVSVNHHTPWNVTDSDCLQLIPTADQAAELTAKQKKCYLYISPPYGYNKTLDQSHGVNFCMMLGGYLYYAMTDLRPSGNVNTDYQFRLWRRAIANPSGLSPATTPTADGGWTDITPFTYSGGPLGLTGNPFGACETNIWIEPAPDNINLMLIRSNENNNGSRTPSYSWVVETAVTWIKNDGTVWSDFIFISQYMNADWSIGTAGARYVVGAPNTRTLMKTLPFDVYKGATTTYDKENPELRYFKTMVTDITGVDDFVISAYHFTYGAAPALVGFWPSSLWDLNNHWPDHFLPKEHATYHAVDFQTPFTSPDQWDTQYNSVKSLHYDALRDQAWDFARPGIDSNYAPAAFMNYDARFTYASDPSWSFSSKQYDVRSGYPWARMTFSGTTGGDDPRSWAPSENIAIQTYNILKGFYTLGTLIVGAQATDNDFTPSNLLTAFSICDELITLHAADDRGRTSEPRYSGGMMIASSNATQDALKAMQLAMDGQIYDCGGKINLFPGKAKTPILNLTDEDIIWSEEQSWQPYADLSSLWNVVTGSYVPEDQNFQQATFASQTNPTYQVDDGGERIVMNLDYAAVHSNEGIQRITKRVLEAGRFQGLVGFVGPLWIWQLEQGDWYTLTSSKWGFTTKSFEVKAITFAKDLKVAVVGQEVSASVDTWDPETMLQDFSVGSGGPRWGRYDLSLTSAMFLLAISDSPDAHPLVASEGATVATNECFLDAGGTLIRSQHMDPLLGAARSPSIAWDFVLPRNLRRSQNIYMEVDFQIVGAWAQNLQAWVNLYGIRAYLYRVNGSKSVGEIIGNPAAFNYPYDTYGCDVITPFKEELGLIRPDSGGQTIKVRIPTNAGVTFDPMTSISTPAPELRGGDHVTLYIQFDFSRNNTYGLEERPAWSRGESDVNFIPGNTPVNVSFQSATTFRTGIPIPGTPEVSNHSSPQVITFDSTAAGNAGVALKEVSTVGGLIASSGSPSSVLFYKVLSPDWPTATDIWAKVLCMLDGTGTPDNTGGFNKVKITAVNVVTGATYAGVAYDTDDISDKKMHQVLFNIPHTPTTGAGNLTAGDWLAFIIEIPTKVTTGTGNLKPFIYRATVDVFPDNDISGLDTGTDDWDIYIEVPRVRVLVPLNGPGGITIPDVVNPQGVSGDATNPAAIADGKVVCYHSTYGTGVTIGYPDRTVASDQWAILGVVGTSINDGVTVTDHSTAAGGNGGTFVQNGTVRHTGWTWTIGDTLYVGDVGAITATRPVTGWVHVIGVALSATEIRLSGPTYPISTATSE